MLHSAVSTWPGMDYKMYYKIGQNIAMDFNNAVVHTFVNQNIYQSN